MMNTRQLRFCLFGMGASLFGAALLTLVWSAVSACNLGEVDSELHASEQMDRRVTRKPISAIGASDFEPYWQRRLRDTTVRIPSSMSQPLTGNPQMTGLPFKLLATLIEPGSRRAVFAMGKDGVQIASAGSHFGQGLLQTDVLKVDRQKAVVKFQERIYQLSLEEESK